MVRKFFLLPAFVSFGILLQAQSIPKWKIGDVVNYFNKNNDTVYVVNFWATFCKPCVAEIPYFISICKKYKDRKVKLLLVSLDLPDYYPARIAAFAKKRKFNTRIVWLNETDADIFCPRIDKKWSGAIPATIIVNGHTGFRKFVEDDIKQEEFEALLKQAIGI
jgi:thiol-disulfide isomerase/thioredoxin